MDRVVDGNAEGDGEGDESGAGGGDGGDGESQGWDEHIIDPAEREMSEAEVNVAVQSAKSAAEAMGKMPGALQRLVGELLDPQVDWEDQLREKITAKSGCDSETWKRPNRRRLCLNPRMFMPSREGFQIGGIAIVIDTSGSISNDMVTRFLSEVAGILEQCKPEWTKVLWTDTRVAHVDEVEDTEDLKELTAHGGGGTDMEAAFKYIDDKGYEPSNVVVLTDGYTCFTDDGEPEFPVIWAITSDVVPPYGDLVSIDDA